MEKLTYTHNDAAAKALASYYETPPLAYVRSYGCQQNVNDGEKIKGVLQDVGYGLCDTAEQADLILFNTCAVREHAEQRVFGNVGALKKLKEENPRLMIGICGCMAQQEHIVEKLRQSYPYVDLVFGVDGIDRLPAMLAERIRKGKRYLEKPSERNAVVEEMPIRRDSGFRAWLPIMYGCDNFCTYCIVPYVRGRERSREPAAILAEFRQLVAQGYKEITLLGQNVNSYGKGLENPIDFADLLNLLCEVPGDYQIRFMTSHPKDASRKLIDTIAAQEHLCKHIHLPVQSGSDRLLKEMNRHYDVAQYMDLIHYAKEKIPGVTFSSDIIVGFPGETEEDFEATLELIRKVGYMQLFTFIYSKRNGSQAAGSHDPRREGCPHGPPAENAGGVRLCGHRRHGRADRPCAGGGRRPQRGDRQRPPRQQPCRGVHSPRGAHRPVGHGAHHRLPRRPAGRRACRVNRYQTYYI